MAKEVSIVLKNIVLKGNATDNKGSTGDVKITADPDTVMAMAQYLEEVLADEN